MDVRVGLRRLSTKELMVLNCGENAWESFGLQGNQINQSLNEINPEHSLEGLMLKLKLPILWPPDVNSLLIRKDPDAGKEWRHKEEGVAEDEIDSITNSMSMNLTKLWERVKDNKAWHAAVHGVAKSQTRLTNWTAKISLCYTEWFTTNNLLFKARLLNSEFYNYRHKLFSVKPWFKS